MSLIDWLMVVFPLAIVVITGIYAQQYVKSVADFVSANRSAGRYLLCIAGSELQTGAVVFVMSFEIFTHGGFAYGWWGDFSVPVGIILTITGFVSYRFRETRAMTLAQFFEIRYNKSFRLFTGLLGYFAGMLNFGIIPAIGARAMVYFFNLPENIHVLSVTLPTYVPLMALFLCVSSFVALSGGIVTVMLINTIEGIMSQVIYLVIIVTILYMFSWSQMHDVLLNREPGNSMVNPFDTSKVQDFNIWTTLMGLVTGIIGTTISWQNAGGYKGAALTPHEGRMASIINTWQGMGKAAVVTLLALAAITYLHNPAFASGATHVEETVHQIANKQAAEEMEAPIALAYLLPVGVKGLFCAVLLMGIFGGDATHLTSWSSILIQDVIVPLRKNPFGPRAHLFVLRCSILGVAFFAFLFGTFFPIADYISMWFGVTQAIFTGGAGAAIIGGLYWKKGTSTGAWAGFLTGSVLTVSGIIAQKVYTEYGWKFPMNGVQIGFISSLLAVAAYVTGSLLTYKEDFDLDRMLHRGKYAKITSLVGDKSTQHLKQPIWARYIGLDDNFTLGDRWLAIAMVTWSMFWFFVFVIFSVWNLVAPWNAESWATFYSYKGIWLPVFFAFVTSIWFTWGGLSDMRALFVRLNRERANALDDGTVVGNRNLDEVAAETKAPETFVNTGTPEGVMENRTTVSNGNHDTRTVGSNGNHSEIPAEKK